MKKSNLVILKNLKSSSLKTIRDTYLKAKKDRNFSLVKAMLNEFPYSLMLSFCYSEEGKEAFRPLPYSLSIAKNKDTNLNVSGEREEKAKASFLKFLKEKEDLTSLEIKNILLNKEV